MSVCYYSFCFVAFFLLLTLSLSLSLGTTTSSTTMLLLPLPPPLWSHSLFVLADAATASSAFADAQPTQSILSVRFVCLPTIVGDDTLGREREKACARALLRVLMHQQPVRDTSTYQVASLDEVIFGVLPCLKGCNLAEASQPEAPVLHGLRK